MLARLWVLLFLSVSNSEEEDEKIAELLLRPWVNPYNFAQKVQYGKHCPGFKCPEPLVCAYLKSSKITFKTPMFCDYPEFMCDLDAFNRTKNVGIFKANIFWGSKFTCPMLKNTRFYRGTR